MTRKDSQQTFQRSLPCREEPSEVVNMVRQSASIAALRMHHAHLRYAVATTTSLETVAALRQMLVEVERKLAETETRPPEDDARLG